MIGISKLYCGTVEPSDALRYGRMSSKLPSHLLQFSSDKRPVVVWNVTRRCNLKCVHCYAHAKNIAFDNELSTSEGKILIDDLTEFGVPVIDVMLASFKHAEFLVGIKQKMNWFTSKALTFASPPAEEIRKWNIPVDYNLGDIWD